MTPAFPARHTPLKYISSKTAKATEKLETPSYKGVTSASGWESFSSFSGANVSFFSVSESISVLFKGGSLREHISIFSVLLCGCFNQQYFYFSLNLESPCWGGRTVQAVACRAALYGFNSHPQLQGF